jgi:hypothetical protein
MCRMPGEDEKVDLVQIETIASASGQRLPEFPIDLHVSPAAGAEPVRKLNAKTDHEGRVRRVVRVPAGAEVAVRAMPPSMEGTACEIHLNLAANAAETRSFARSAALPVRGKSRMMDENTESTNRSTRANH